MPQIPNGSLQFLAIFVLICVSIDTGTGTSVFDKYGANCNSLDAHFSPRPGLCVHFLFCPRLLEFAKRSGKTLEEFRILKKLTCGFRDEKPKICCPEEDIYHPPRRDETEDYSFSLHFPDEYDEPLNPSPVAPLSMQIGISHNWGLPSEINFENEGVPSFKRIDEMGTNHLIPSLEDCGDPKQDISTSIRIIGGTRAVPGQFPYMALLFRIDTETDVEEHFCAGTIINKFYILTAGHCILTNSNSTDVLAFIQVGVTNILERCQHNSQKECAHDRRYEIEETIVHPKYIYGSRDRNHDIALIRTKKPMEFDGKYIRPVCLPFKDAYGIPNDNFGQIQSLPYVFEDGDIGVVAGWGREFNHGPQSSTHLKSAILPIMPRHECQLRYESQVRISDKHICAGGDTGGRDTCIGDSGGPLLVPYESLTRTEGKYTGKMFQTGIISFGPSICGTNGRPSVYTRVDSYIDWIINTMHP